MTLLFHMLGQVKLAPVQGSPDATQSMVRFIFAYAGQPYFRMRNSIKYKPTLNGSKSPCQELMS